MMFREARLAELSDEIALMWRTFPAWCVDAYKAAERAFRLVEAEESAKDPKDKKGADLTIKKTKSSVFALIEEHAEEKKRNASAETDELQALEAAFAEDENLSNEIFEYFREVINE